MAVKAHHDSLFSAPPANPGEIILLRRSSSRIVDPTLLDKQALHHSLAMRAIVPLLISHAASYRWTWHYLNGVEANISPPDFGAICPNRDDYHYWSLTIKQAIERGVEEIALVVQSAVGWSTNAAAVRRWLAGAKRAGVSIRILFWHPTADPAPTVEGKAWCGLYTPLKDGCLGYFLDLTGADLQWPAAQTSGPSSTTISPAMAFDEFCGAINTSEQSEMPDHWHELYRGILTDEEVKVFLDELEGRELLGF